MSNPVTLLLFTFSYVESDSLFHSFHAFPLQIPSAVVYKDYTNFFNQGPPQLQLFDCFDECPRCTNPEHLVHPRRAGLHDRSWCAHLVTVSAATRNLSAYITGRETAPKRLTANGPLLQQVQSDTTAVREPSGPAAVFPPVADPVLQQRTLMLSTPTRG